MASDTELESESNKAHDEDLESNGSNLKNRLILPLAIPVVAVCIVAVLGVSFSRFFLAAANTKTAEEATEVVEHTQHSTVPVLWATIITLIILFGAAGVSLMKSMRSTTFGLLAISAIVSIVLAGAVLSGAGEKHEEAVNYGLPTEAEMATADPANVVEIDALGTNTFQANEFNATTGVVNIRYIGKGGTHLLIFDGDPRFSWFELAVNAGTEAEQAVLLEPGTYQVHCPIPGHEKMRADIVVK